MHFTLYICLRIYEKEGHIIYVMHSRICFSSNVYKQTLTMLQNKYYTIELLFSLTSSPRVIQSTDQHMVRKKTFILNSIDLPPIYWLSFCMCLINLSSSSVEKFLCIQNRIQPLKEVLRITKLSNILFQPKIIQRFLHKVGLKF